MKRTIAMTAMLLICHFSGYGQVSLTIDECQERARNNYPQIRQFALIDKLKEYDLKNANRGYLPQFALSAKATYQSEVTTIPITLPGVEIPTLSRDQYQAVVELNQTIWDGGAIRSQKDAARYSSEVDRQKVEVDLHSLRERVNQLYFGILLLNEQMKQNDLLQQELQNSYDQVYALMNGGMANQSDVDAVRVEQLKAAQRRTELVNTAKAYRDMLALLIGGGIEDSAVLVKPDAVLSRDMYTTNNRAELELFDAQKRLYESNRKSINSRGMPNIGLFGQAGYGKPGLNMLKTEFSPFFIAGVRLSWNFGSYYTRGNNMKRIETQIHGVDVQRDVFMFNSDLQVTQQLAEIEKMQDIIGSDDEIIRLQTNVKDAAYAKLRNGTISTTDLLREVNAENMAVQDKMLHEMQLLVNIENLKTTTNN